MNTFEEIRQFIPKYGKVKATIFYNDGSKEEARLAMFGVSDILKMSPGSRRYGMILRLNNVADVIIHGLKARKTEAQKWEDGWKKVIARLERSGLWVDLLEEYKIGLSIGYDKLKEAYKLYWDLRDEEQCEAIKALDSRLVHVCKDGKERPNTSIIWYVSKLPKVKKMYFGKYRNEAELKKIAECLQNKIEARIYQTVQYDVSFQYDPTQNKAWYSEEYRNCGNGHYYLALDATHALFYEDD